MLGKSLTPGEQRCPALFFQKTLPKISLHLARMKENKTGSGRVTA
jgi:hypothetical protein